MGRLLRGFKTGRALTFFPGLAVWALVLLGACGARGDEPWLEVRLGVDGSCFDHIDEPSALVGLKVLLDEGLRDLDVPVRVSSSFVPGMAELRVGLQTGRFNACAMRCVDYCRSGTQLAVTPLWIPRTYGRPGFRHLLLVQADSPYREIRDLRSTRLAIVNGGETSVPTCWLTARLRGLSCPNPSSFFSAYRRVRKPSQAVVPLFFGQVDCAVVAEGAYETLAELNPQLKRSLRVIDRSSVMPSLLLAVDSTLLARHRALFDRVRGLENTVKGKQLLTMFRVEGLVPFDEEQLRPLRSLLSIVDGGGARGRKSSGESD